MKNQKKRYVKESRMPYSLKCSNNDCGKEIETFVRWKPPGEIHHIECPFCGWVNKRQIARSALDAWYHTGHDMKIRLLTEGVEDIAHIISEYPSLQTDYRQRLYEIERCMKILNVSEITKRGSTDDDYEI